jgi:hypothetical protein
MGDDPRDDNAFWWEENPLDELGAAGGSFSVTACYYRTLGRPAGEAAQADDLDSFLAADVTRTTLRMALYNAMYDLPAVRDTVLKHLYEIANAIASGRCRSREEWGRLIQLWLAAYRLTSIHWIEQDIKDSIRDFVCTNQKSPFRLRARSHRAWPFVPGKWNFGFSPEAGERVDIVVSGMSRFDLRQSSIRRIREEMVAAFDRALAEELDAVHRDAEALGALWQGPTEVERDARRVALWHFCHLTPRQIIEFEDGVPVQLPDGSLLMPPEPENVDDLDDLDDEMPLEELRGHIARRTSGVAKQARAYANVMGLKLDKRSPGRPRDPVPDPAQT